jgi:hypothetical protein
VWINVRYSAEMKSKFESDTESWKSAPAVLVRELKLSWAVGSVSILSYLRLGWLC